MKIYPLNRFPIRQTGWGVDTSEVPVTGAPAEYYDSPSKHYRNSVYLDGFTDSITFPAFIDATGDFTVGLYFKMENYRHQDLFAINGETNIWFYLKNNSLFVRVAGTEYGLEILWTNDWQHLAIVHDGDQFRVYVNGVKKLDQTIAFSTTVTSVTLGKGTEIGTNFMGQVTDLWTDEAVHYDADFTPKVSLPCVMIGLAEDFSGNILDTYFWIFKKEQAKSKPVDWSTRREVFPYPEGYFYEPHPAEEMAFVLSKSKTSAYNSFVLDDIVPSEYEAPVFVFDTSTDDGTWIEAKPITINMDYKSPVDIDIISTNAAGFEFKVNEGAWTTSNFKISDGDIVRLRLQLPADPYGENFEGVIRIGPAAFKFSNYVNGLGEAISEVNLTTALFETITIPGPSFNLTSVGPQSIANPPPAMDLQYVAAQTISETKLGFEFQYLAVQGISKVTV